jgi:hypothetical protein
MTPLEQAQYLTTMIGMGYYSVKPIRNQEYWVGLFDFLFTTAIIVGKMGDTLNIYDRWCYHSREDAQKALDNWNGIDEPEGWHRHPSSGRRRQNGLEIVYP